MRKDTIRNRLGKIEKLVRPKPTVAKYLCVMAPAFGEPGPEGYKIQPCTRDFGGTNGEPFYLRTEAEVQAFGARPDVELKIIRIVYGDTE